MPKPSDFFLGVVEFLALLVPGAVATYAGWLVVFDHRLPNGFFWSSPVEGWLVFAGVSYLVGHLLGATSGSTLDLIYDCFYVPLRRVNPARLPKSRAVRLAGIWAKWKERLQRWKLSRSTEQLVDPLLEVAQHVKETDLMGLSRRAGVDPSDVTNLFHWAMSVIRTVSPVGAQEVDRIMADSKLFRSLAFAAIVVIVVLTVKFGVQPVEQPAAVVGLAICVLLLPLLWLRFAQLRWAATQRLYEYYVISRVIGASTRADNTSAEGEQVS